MPCEDNDRNDRRPGADAMAGRRLYQSRIILICSDINQDVAREFSQQVLAMSAENDDPIYLYLNSQGGHVEAGDTIHDLIKFVRPKVKIIGTGWVASAGAHIFLAAPREDRYCLPNTRFLLHQPSGGTWGPAMDIDIEAKEILKMRERLNKVIADGTGQTLEKVEKDTDRNFWLSAEEAKEYGLVGNVISSQDELEG